MVSNWSLRTWRISIGREWSEWREKPVRCDFHLHINFTNSFIHSISSAVKRVPLPSTQSIIITIASRYVVICKYKRALAQISRSKVCERVCVFCASTLPQNDKSFTFTLPFNTSDDELIVRWFPLIISPAHSRRVEWTKFTHFCANQILNCVYIREKREERMLQIASLDRQLAIAWSVSTTI